MCLAVQKSMPGDGRLHAYAGRRAENCGFCGTRWLGSVSGRGGKCLGLHGVPVAVSVPDMADFASRTLSYGSAFQNVWIGSIGSIVRMSESVLHAPLNSYMQTASLVVQHRYARLTPRSAQSVTHLHRSRPAHIHSQSGILITRRSCDVRSLSTCRLQCVK
jgi:hypothetical protein